MLPEEVDMKTQEECMGGWKSGYCTEQGIVPVKKSSSFLTKHPY
jgi:hypothetical protein